MFETIIIGNVGSVRFARSGEFSVLNLSVATSRRVNDREYTDWVSGKLWGSRGEKLREHISIGMKILLRGRPEAKGFQKGDGTISGELVVHINELEFLSGKPKQAQAEQLPLEAPAPAKTKRRKSAAV